MTEKQYQTIKDDLFSSPIDSPDKVTLMGYRCSNCGEVFLGKAIACQQCQGTQLEPIPLSREGTLYTYSVIRNLPPGDYRGPQPFQPFAAGLVELAEGIRVLAPLTAVDLDHIAINTRMELVVSQLYRDEQGRPVLSYAFCPKERKTA